MKLPQKVLIVEDEIVWQTALRSLLERHKIETVSAFDYAEALTQLERHSTSFALAIVDLQLSDSSAAENRNGLEVLNRLRAKNIYAIVLSAYTNEQAAELVKRPEVYDVADKIRFGDQEYDDFFMGKVQAALAHAALDWTTEQL